MWNVVVIQNGFRRDLLGQTSQARPENDPHTGHTGPAFAYSLGRILNLPGEFLHQ